MHTDDPATFENSPVGLQLSTRTLEDEAAIGMTEIVDAALKAYKYNEDLDSSPRPKL